MKTRVFALGETLLDIIFKDEQPYKAVPGGSMLNAAVSLGRTGLAVELISEFGKDPVGNIISSFLERNHIGYSWSYQYDSHNTSLALAFLDSNRNASYNFYHDTPECLPELPLPDFCTGDILLFGSFYSIKTERRAYVLKLLHSARKAGAILVYDPNIRKVHLEDTIDYITQIVENIQLASIVKGSDEDFNHIFGTIQADEIYRKIEKYCPILIITAGSKALNLFTSLYSATFPVPPVTPVSTIGAGDNFNAGLVYGLIASGIQERKISSLGKKEWDFITGCGLAFATATCLTLDNYVPEGFRSSSEVHI